MPKPLLNVRHLESTVGWLLGAPAQVRAHASLLQLPAATQLRIYTQLAYCVEH